MSFFMIPSAHGAALQVLKWWRCPPRPLHGSAATVTAVVITPAMMSQGCVGITGGGRREIYGSGERGVAGTSASSP